MQRHGVLHGWLTCAAWSCPRQAHGGPCSQAKAAQPAFNRLVDAVARDEPWLEATLRLAAQHDDFTGRLLQLLRDSRWGWCRDSSACW
jgi:hypothetical protein